MYITCQNQVLLIKIGFCIIFIISYIHVSVFKYCNITYTKSLNQEEVEILHNSFKRILNSL